MRSSLARGTFDEVETMLLLVRSLSAGLSSSHADLSMLARALDRPSALLSASFDQADLSLE